MLAFGSLVVGLCQECGFLDDGNAENLEYWGDGHSDDSGFLGKGHFADLATWAIGMSTIWLLRR